MTVKQGFAGVNKVFAYWMSTSALQNGTHMVSPGTYLGHILETVVNVFQYTIVHVCSFDETVERVVMRQIQRSRRKERCRIANERVDARLDGPGVANAVTAQAHIDIHNGQQLLAPVGARTARRHLLIHHFHFRISGRRRRFPRHDYYPTKMQLSRSSRARGSSANCQPDLTGKRLSEFDCIFCLGLERMIGPARCLVERDSDPGPAWKGRECALCPAFYEDGLTGERKPCPELNCVVAADPL